MGPSGARKRHPLSAEMDACGTRVPAVKQKRTAAEDVLLLSFRQMLGLIGVCLRPVLYPSDGELLDEGMNV